MGGMGETVLGSYPSERCSLSWITQRLLNRAPEYSEARSKQFSIAQQLINPQALRLEETIQQLQEERQNIFLSSANIDLLSKTYMVRLPAGMKFTMSDVEGSYTVPEVWTDDTTRITIAEKNNIETFWYKALPSRISLSDTILTYQEVIPRVAISELGITAPRDISIPSKLYITIIGNTTWFAEDETTIYYPKVYITGIARKDMEITEVVPINYNGTFETINQFSEVSEVFVSYMDDTAEISICYLQTDNESYIDNRNILVWPDGTESYQFLRLGTEDWPTLVYEGFTAGSLENIQLGFDNKEILYEVELKGTSGDTIYLSAIAFKPFTDYMFALNTAGNTIYVFNVDPPCPDFTVLPVQDIDAKVSIESDKWTYKRGDTAYIRTKNHDITKPPWKIRWTLTSPNGDQHFIGKDGTLWDLDEEAWIWNEKFEEGHWFEQEIPITISAVGTYGIKLECFYSSAQNATEQYTLSSSYLLYAPSINAECSFSLELELGEIANEISFDSDGNLWVVTELDDTILAKLLEVHYDYFLVDYEHDAIYLREPYTSVTVNIDP